MPNKTQPSRLTAGCQPCRGTAQYATAPEIRKQTEPKASGRHTRRLYCGFDRAVSRARKVDALKKSVPANWTAALQNAPFTPPGACRSGIADTSSSATPVVKK